MKLPEWLRLWGRWGRALLLPIGDIDNHLCFLARRTAKELGAQPEVIQRLEVLTIETCQEIGLVTAENNKTHSIVK